MARNARRLIVWTCACLLGLLLLALLAIVVVVLTVDPDRFRGRIETAATAALGRGVHLTGELHWTLGWRTALGSRGGYIDNVPGFTGGHFAEWQALRLGVAIRPLLRRELHIDRIEIDGLILRLQRDATGAVNWQVSGATDTGTAGGTDLELAVGSVALRDATVSYQDAGAGQQWQLSRLDVDVELPPDLLASQLSVQDISLRGFASGAPIAAPGVPFALQADEVNVDREAQTLAVPEWRMEWGDARLEGAVQARASPQTAQASIRLQAPSLRNLLGSISLPLPLTRDPEAFGPLRLDARADWRDGAATIGGLDVELDDTKLTGQVNLPSVSPLTLRFELAADRVNVDRYMPPEDAQGEPLELPLEKLKALDAKGVLTIGEARMAGAAAKRLRIDVE